MLLVAGVACGQPAAGDAATGGEAAAGGAASWCEPRPELREALDELDAWNWDDCKPAQPCWAARIERARALRERFPDDHFVHAAYRGLVRWENRQPGADDPALAEEYQKLASAHPDSVVLQAAWAAAASAEDQKALWHGIVERAPEFPWAQLGLITAELRTHGEGERDEALIRTALDRFQALCPAQVEWVLSYSHLLDAPYWQPKVAGLRAQLAASPPRSQVRAFPRLWELEFRIAPMERHDEVRQRIRGDLAQLAALDLIGSDAWWSARRQGLELAGDDAGLERLSEEMLAARPCGSEAVRARLERWNEAHPEPGPDAGREERTGWARQTYEATQEWLAGCPDIMQYWLVRLGTLEHLPDLPASRVAADLERILAEWETSKSLFGMWETPSIRVARVAVDRHVLLDRVSALVDAELASRDEQRGHMARHPNEEQRREMLFSDDVQRARIDVVRARGQIALGTPGAARATLDAVATTLDGARQTAGEVNRGEQTLHAAEAGLAQARSELAVAEGRTLDAALLMRRAALLGGTRPELAERAATLWREAGGTDEGWAALTSAEVTAAAEMVGTAIAAPSSWSAGTTVLKPFELRELAGRTWTPADLAGKVVFANVWATWCGPCREELPLLGKLAERLAGRDDVRVVTFNVDRNIGTVAPFVAREKLALPVLLAERYVSGLYDGSLTIPRNWILDRDGTVRWEQVGFDPSQGERWVDEAARLIDELAGAAPPAGDRDRPAS